jgi:TPR repeat protein
MSPSTVLTGGDKELPVNQAADPHYTLKDVLFARSLAHSALLGNSESSFQLGHLFFDGKGVAQDRTVASWWYSKASAAGHSLSKFTCLALKG